VCESDYEEEEVAAEALTNLRRRILSKIVERFLISLRLRSTPGPRLGPTILGKLTTVAAADFPATFFFFGFSFPTIPALRTPQYAFWNAAASSGPTYMIRYSNSLSSDTFFSFFGHDVICQNYAWV